MTIKQDDDDMLRDGETMTVPLILMDSAPTDPTVRLEGHRPGYAVLSDAARNQRIERQRSQDAALNGRWRGTDASENLTVDTRGSTPRERYQARISSAWRRR
jgi:hypothetical protein